MASIQELLFRPFESPKLQLDNRVVMAPMTRNRSPNYVPNEDVVAYYERRAAADVGLLITEGTTINHKASNGYEDVPAFHGEDSLAGWKKVVDAVHAAGGKIAPQLWHVGALRKPRMGPDPEVPGYSPSGLVKPGKKRTEVLSESDIQEVVDAFGQAAFEAKALGFDALELHGAHGYLIDQFFWKDLNERSDRYGGSLEARTTFAVEIIKKVRERVGADFPIIFRYSQWKQQDYTARLAQTPQELETFLTPLADAGVDIFHASTRRFWEPEFPESNMNLAGWTKEITGLPTITVGSVGLNGVEFTDFAANAEVDQDLEKLRKPLENEEFDLVAVGRSLLADPLWAKKLKEGQFSELKPYSATSLGTYI